MRAHRAGRYTSRYLSRVAVRPLVQEDLGAAGRLLGPHCSHETPRGEGGVEKADQAAADCAPPPPGRSSQRSRAGLPSRSDNLDAAAGRKKKLKAIKRRAHKTREKATTPLARAENTFRPPRRGSSSSSSSSRFLEENGPLARSRKSSRDPNKESSRESSGRAPPRNKTEGRKESTTNNSAERRRKTEGREGGSKSAEPVEAAGQKSSSQGEGAVSLLPALPPPPPARAAATMFLQR